MSNDPGKKIITEERMPGEDAFKAMLRTAPKPEWQKALAQESVLIPNILRLQRTFRLAKMVPTWNLFRETRMGWEAQRAIDAADWRKLKAWWELLLEAQRHPDDKAAVALALFFVMIEHTGIRKEPDYARHRMDPQHGRKIHEAVKRRMKNLHPVEVTPGADVRELMRPKYERQ